MTGFGHTRVLRVSGITVGEGQDVTVSVKSDGKYDEVYAVNPAQRTAAVHRAASQTANINWNTLTANGTPNDVSTTDLTLTFDGDIENLTADLITVEGAVKGGLSGSGASWTLAVSDISVANGENVTVTLTNPEGFEISPLFKTVAVNRATAGWIGLTANGSAGTADTTALTLTFDKDPVGLTAEDIQVNGAVRGALNGTGTSRTLAVSGLTVGEGEEVHVNIVSNPPGLDITPKTRSAAVHKKADAGPVGGSVSIPDFIPAYGGVEPAVSAVKFGDKSGIPSSLSGVTVVEGGTVVADRNAVIGGLGGKGTAIDADNYDVLRLPVFKGEVTAPGNTCVVMLMWDTDAYAGLNAGVITALKLLPDETTEILKRAASLEYINDGQFVLMNENGKELSGGDVIVGGRTYGLAVAVADGGKYDWDGVEDGYVFDPISLAAREQAAGGNSGGCNAGFPLSALVVCGLAFVIRRRVK
jgi:hypothetical protein